jgi:hypothetical protein
MKNNLINLTNHGLIFFIINFAKSFIKHFKSMVALYFHYFIISSQDYSHHLASSLFLIALLLLRIINFNIVIRLLSLKIFTYC